nr:hypothetical protein Iba_chr03aCG1450 [Ipomoea batatas]
MIPDESSEIIASLYSSNEHQRDVDENGESQKAAEPRTGREGQGRKGYNGKRTHRFPPRGHRRPAARRPVARASSGERRREAGSVHRRRRTALAMAGVRRQGDETGGEATGGEGEQRRAATGGWICSSEAANGIGYGWSSAARRRDRRRDMFGGGSGGEEICGVGWFGARKMEEAKS